MKRKVLLTRCNNSMTRMRMIKVRTIIMIKSRNDNCKYDDDVIIDNNNDTDKSAGRMFNTCLISDLGVQSVRAK